MDKCELDVGYLLDKAARLTKWELNKRLEELGLTLPQVVVLKDLNTQVQRNSELQNLTPASIAQRLHVERSTLSGLIARLIKKGLVYSVNNPEDRRSQIIRLTEKSKTLLVSLEVLFDETTNRAIKGFDEAEINELRRYLKRIIDNFSL